METRKMTPRQVTRQYALNADNFFHQLFYNLWTTTLLHDLTFHNLNRIESYRIESPY